MTPDITVLIPVRNHEHFIGSAIESVLGQTYNNFSLVVSDNCSTDGTRAIVTRYVKGDARVSLVENEKDVGGMENFNRCLGMVNTPYFMLLCSDDLLWAPTALEKAREVLDRCPDVAAVYCDMALVDEDGKMILPRRFGREGLIESRIVARQCVRTARNWFGIPLLMRSACAKGLQYDPAAGYASDVDFSIAVTRGTPIYHIKELLVANRYHGGNATRQVAWLARQHILAVARKHGIHLSWLEYCILTLTYLITFLKKYVFFLVLAFRKKRKVFMSRK